MTDEKRKKKFGLSLKTSKKTVVECHEESRAASRQLTKNIRHEKPKLNAHSINDIADIDIDDHSHLGAKQSKANYEIKKITDSNQNDKERLLWSSVFSSERHVNWEDLEDLPKFDGSNSKKNLDASNATATKTVYAGQGNANNNNCQTRKDSTNKEFDYIELPKPCLSCYARKPVQLEYSTKEIPVSQSLDVEKEVETLLAKESQETKLNHSKFSINKDNYNSRTVSPVVEDIDDDEMLRILDDEPTKRKVRDHDEDLENNFLRQPKKPFLEKNAITNVFKKIESKKDDQSNCQKQESNSVFHRTSNDYHGKSKNISRTMNKQEKHSKLQTHSFIQKPQSSYFQRNDLAPVRSFPKSNIVIDLTDDNTDPESYSIDRNSNRAIQKSTKLEQSNIVNPPRHNSSESFGESNPCNERLTKTSSEYHRKEELKCCPICQLQFAYRTSKQEIDKHISSCIEDEVIAEDNSDEDWLFTH